ncbi:MAG: AIR synthase related protein [Gammaproteobacteria bacterium]|jgi:hydrogenase maturation factor
MKQQLRQGKLPAALLQKLIRFLPVADQSLVIPPGVGLDAAGLKIGNKLVAVTTDPITFATNHIASYSVAVNVNDIACLGCKPRWYSGVLLLPYGASDAESVENIWTELARELQRYGITSVGGHVEVTKAVHVPILVGQIIGEAVRDELLDARNVSPGDQILLCQAVAVEGTALLAQERAAELLPILGVDNITKIQNFLQNPGICVWPYAEKLFSIPDLIALHDPTEGGIATALHELADVAGCGLAVDCEKISVLPETKQFSQLFNFNPLGLLASGSLLIVCKPKAVDQIVQQLGANQVTPIGVFTKEQHRKMNLCGEIKDLPRYDQDELIPALQHKMRLIK